MRCSQLFYPTLREVPSEADVISHQWLLRAGFIRRTTSGVYTYLPLGYRVIKKITEIVRQEMDRAGGQEVMMPIVQPAELWQQSGRWDVYGEEMFRLRDRHQRAYCWGLRMRRLSPPWWMQRCTLIEICPCCCTRFRTSIVMRSGRVSA